MGLSGHMSWPGHVLNDNVLQDLSKAHGGPRHWPCPATGLARDTLSTCIGHVATPLDMANVHDVIPRGHLPWPWTEKIKTPKCVAQTLDRTTPELPTWIGHVPRGHGFSWSGSCLVTFSFPNPIGPSFDSLSTMSYFLVF